MTDSARAVDVFGAVDGAPDSVNGEWGLQFLEAPVPVSRRRGWLLRRLLVLADLVGLLAAIGATELIFIRITPGAKEASLEILILSATLPAWLVIAHVYGLYGHDDRRTNHTTVDEVADVFHMITVCTWVFFAFSWITHIAHPAVPKLLLFWVTAVLFVPLLRTAARAIARSNDAYVQNTVIVGAGDVGQTVAETLVRHPEYGINLVGFVDSEPKEQRASLEHLTILGPPESLPAVVQQYDIERVIIAFSRDSHERVLELIRSLKDLWVQIDIVPRYYELIGAGAGISGIEGIPLVGLRPRALAPAARFLKRAMDIVVSAVALIVLSPLLLVIAIAIFFDSPGQVFFRQLRVGADGSEFRILKFRTMVPDAESRKEAVAHLNKHRHEDGGRMFKIADDPRATRVGAFLRRTSLDELPQLVNVLHGEMSLVGPRPLIPAEAAQVSAWGKSRLELKPGITGVWQVLGRSDIPFDEMVRLDYLYVTGWSLWNDLRLICRTPPLMFKGGRGAY
jgi:exopolysaccharide biosynthesis polyprenyl glycosylphosphotransferase